jgi:hypothetical protein
VAGVAFGSVARHQLQPLLLQAQARGQRLLDAPELLGPALALASALVGPWRERQPPKARHPSRDG